MIAHHVVRSYNIATATAPDNVYCIQLGRRLLANVYCICNTVPVLRLLFQQLCHRHVCTDLAITKRFSFKLSKIFISPYFQPFFYPKFEKCQNLGVRDFVFQISGTSSLINFLPKAFLPKLYSTKQFNIMKCGGLSVFYIL
jgi:hypothetical protein